MVGTFPTVSLSEDTKNDCGKTSPNHGLSGTGLHTKRLTPGLYGRGSMTVEDICTLHGNLRKGPSHLCIDVRQLAPASTKKISMGLWPCFVCIVCLVKLEPDILERGVSKSPFT